MQEESGYEKKVTALRQIIKNKGKKALRITQQKHFSWLTGGRGFIGLASTGSCGELIITPDQVFLLANNIEINRLQEEENKEASKLTCLSYPWYDPNQKKAQLAGFGSDQEILMDTDIEGDLLLMRSQLQASEQGRLRRLAQTAAQVLEGVARQLKKGMSEVQLAGQISSRLWQKNIEPITLLIAFDERMLAYRHPVPTEKRLDNLALLAICARQNGLIVSVSRLVALNQPEAPWLEKQAKVAQVEAQMQAATQPGTSLEDIFKISQATYQKVGYPEEWKAHHQGGLTGYVARELKAQPGETHQVRVGESYAWNPSIQGTKSENTLLVTPEGTLNLTYTGNYVYQNIEIEGKSYPIEDMLIINKS